MATKKSGSGSKRGRRASSTAKRTAPRRKPGPSRKKTSHKSTTARKKTSSARKKTSSGRKKSSGRKYGRKSERKVGRALHEMKRGKLKSGRSGKTVKSRKQAIAIGLSEARREGDAVPPKPKR